MGLNRLGLDRRTRTEYWQKLHGAEFWHSQGWVGCRGDVGVWLSKIGRWNKSLCNHKMEDPCHDCSDSLSQR
jgi:hypothetical protein